MHKLRKESTPWVMAAGRAALGPILVLGQRCGWTGASLAGIVLAALLSDIFDGVLARRWRCDTAAVRLLDSAADTVFYGSVAVALWARIPGLWHTYGVLLVAVLLGETVNHGASIVKFGKPASYHSYLAKSWGLVLATAVVSAFVIGDANLLISSALLLGIVCNAEGLAMTALLPAWHKDVKSLRAAWRMRAPESAHRHISSNAGTAAASIAVVVLLAVPSKVLAAGTARASYAGGTAPLAIDTAGTLDAASPSALIFTPASADAAPTPITIAYASIRSIEERKDVVRHLGVLPAAAVGLIAARQRRYTLSIAYADANGTQVASFELGERDQHNLETILRARAPEACLTREYMPCPRPRPVQHNETPGAIQPQPKPAATHTDAVLLQSPRPTGAPAQRGSNAGH